MSQLYQLTGEQLDQLRNLLSSLHKETGVKKLIFDNDELLDQVASCESLLQGVEDYQGVAILQTRNHSPHGSPQGTTQSPKP